MTMRTRALTLLLVIGLPLIASAQTDWLSSELLDALVEDLAGRLRAVDPQGEVVADDGVAMARSGIAGTVARIEAAGVEGILASAPDFPALELPSAGEPHLDAIVHWGLCAFPAQAAYADSSTGDGMLQRRLTAAAMTTTVALVNSFLRHEYLEAGTTDDDLRSFYARPEIMSVIGALQTDGELILETMKRCLEPLDELMH
jgi:hypothetical protein